MLLKFIPDDTRFAFMRLRRISFPFMAATALAAFFLFVFQGLNFGIDFRGGTLLEVQSTDGPVDVAAMRGALGELDLGDVQIQEFGSPRDVLIRIGADADHEQAQQAIVSQVRDALGPAFEFRRVETVGPRVSDELVQNSTVAVLFAFAVVLVYLWFRFEWQFALGAVITTIHDVLITLGMFALLRIDFDLTSIAAILTITGYSLNDTVVVYDRIREMMKRYKRMPIEELLDLSVNATLSRTIITSVTTLLAVLALYIFGGEVIAGFSLAMLFGVVVGTYSTTFLSAPLLIYLGLRAQPPAADAGETAPEAASA